jgi:hypothetical protein
MKKREFYSKINEVAQNLKQEEVPKLLKKSRRMQDS